MTEIAQRILDRTEITETCWIWKGYTDKKGYGHLSVPDGDRWRPKLVHRLAYQVWVGPIPEGLQLDHLCRNRACVRPEHLEPVTNRTNVLRGTGLTAQNAQKTHCPQGHPYDKENTYWYVRDGRRVGRWCRRCACARTKRAREARAAVAGVPVPVETPAIQVAAPKPEKATGDFRSAPVETPHGLIADEERDHADLAAAPVETSERCEKCRHEAHEGRCRAQVGTGYMGYVQCACTPVETAEERAND